MRTEFDMLVVRHLHKHVFLGRVALGTTLDLSYGQTGLIPRTNSLCYLVSHSGTSFYLNKCG